MSTAPTANRPRQSVLTIAIGPVVYWRMAVNLARSIQWCHPAGDVPVTIATDRTDPLPADLTAARVERLAPGELGEGFEPKLHLDRLAPTARTLFIDSDCLVYAPLDPVFGRLAGRPVATIGSSIADGEWFGDVQRLCAALGVGAIPKFNGGVYYLERGTASAQVFATARSLRARYDDLGLVRLRGRPNDELLIASAMAQHGLQAVPDDGSMLSDFLCCPGRPTLNVLRHRRVLRNPPPGRDLHRPWYPFRAVSPVIVHYLGEFATAYPYRTEARRLALAGRGWPAFFADLAARVREQLPGAGLVLAKRLLRPIYRGLFGYRPVQPSSRLT